MNNPPNNALYPSFEQPIISNSQPLIFEPLINKNQEAIDPPAPKKVGSPRFIHVSRLILSIISIITIVIIKIDSKCLLWNRYFSRPYND